MSNKTFVKHGIFIFIGTNIANFASYILYILLLRFDKNLFNSYVPVTSILSIFFVFSLIIFRAFATFGDSLYMEVAQKVASSKRKVVVLSALFIIMSGLVSIIISKFVILFSPLAIFLMIILAVDSYIYSMYRGLRQYDGHLWKMVIGLNVETFARLFIGFFLGYILKFNIEGILVSMIVGHLIGIIVMYKKPAESSHSTKLNENLYKIFKSSFIFTLGLELFINIFVIYANLLFKEDQDLLTKFNTLEFIRKTVILSIVTISGYIISTNRKAEHSKKMVFIFSLISSALVAGLALGTFYIFKNQLSNFINLDLNKIDKSILYLYFLGTLISSIVYLISNWLFSFQTKLAVYLPLVIASLELIILIALGSSLLNVALIFAVINIVMLIVYLVASAVYLKKETSNEVATDLLIPEILE